MSDSLNQGSLGSGSVENDENGSSLENTSSPYGSISQSSTPENDDKINTTAYSESDAFIQNFITNTGNTIIHPYTITILVIIGLIIYVKNSINPDPFNTNSGLENIVWTLIFSVLFIDILHYYFNIHISTIVQNTYEFILDIFKFIKDFLFRAFGIDQVIDSGSSVNGSSVNEPILDEEVFHIPGNKYTFTEADGLCKAFGARLASYDEIESAYNKGGEWCSYGWSEGQMAYFPTQKSTFNELQKYPKQKNNCGRPGVNGGYMANPYIKFGVNCYGMKPDMKNKDEKYMKASETRVHKTNNINNGSNSQTTDNVTVASFNTTDWNQYERM